MQTILIIFSITGMILITLQPLLKNFIITYYKKHPKELIDYYFKKKTIIKYPCFLFATIVFDSNFEGYSYDFSQYNETNNIYYTLYKKEKIPEELMDEDDDSNIRTVYMSKQIICLMEDGTYQWDVRQEL